MPVTSGPIMGTLLLQSLDGETILCTTSATLNITNEETETSCKDNGGAYTAIPGRTNWSVQIQGNIIYDNAYGVRDLAKLVVSKATTEMVFGNLSNPDDPVWTGDCFISSYSESAPNNAVATWDVTLTPRGPITYTDPTATP